jgi:two-component sensor histidine kinase
MRHFLIILSLYTLLCPRLFARPDTSGFLHFSISNGLPTNNVYSVVQDKLGYLWFATDNGVVKYNGYVFDVYNTGRGLPGNDIWELFVDGGNRVWINSHNYELGFIKNGKYKKLAFKPTDRINMILQFMDAGDVTYLIEKSNNTNNIIIANDEILRIFPFSEFQNIGGKGLNTGISLVSTDKIIFWHSNRDLIRLERRDAHLSYGVTCQFPEQVGEIFTSKSGVDRKDHMSIFKQNGNVLSIFDTKTCKVDSIALKHLGADPNEGIYAYNPHYMSGNYAQNNVLITNSHLYTFTKTMKLLKREKISDFLPVTSQLAYRMIDNKGNSWFTTNGSGVWSRSTKYEFNLSGNKSEKLTESSFIGQTKGRAYWWSGKERTLYEVTGAGISAEIKFPYAVELKNITSDSNYFYVSANSTIFRFHKDTKRVEDISGIYKIRSYIFPGDNGKYKQDRMPLEQLRKIKKVDNSIYVLSSYGLAEYNIKGDELICKRVDQDRYADFLFDGLHRAFYCYSSRRIFIKYLDANESKLIRENGLDSLGVGNIRSIAKDNKGNIFILDDKNLFYCDRGITNVRPIRIDFSISDAYMQVSGERVYLAGKFGLGYFDVLGKGKFGAFKMIPNRSAVYYARVYELAVIEREGILLRTDKGVHLHNSDSLEKYASSDDYLGRFDLILAKPTEKKILWNDTFLFNQKDEKIILDAINYHGAGEVIYSYKIATKKDWDESNSGELFVGTLIPGRYYRIDCKLRDELWRSRIFTFYIYRKPFWYQTENWKTIFWITGVLIFMVLVFVAVLLTRFYVTKKNERRRALTELELRAIHSQINPHFIFNTLSTSLFFISKNRLDDAYDHVNKFSKLLRSYLKSSQDRYVMLGEEIGMLRSYIELQQVRFENKFDFKVEVDNKLPLANIKIPSLLLQPLVENAINHGLFHRRSDGFLLLKFMQGGDASELICIIDDNGVGRAAAKKINESNSGRDSFGTKLTTQLLEVFRRYEQLNIDLKYEDKEAPDSGTKVILTLKNIKYSLITRYSV